MITENETEFQHYGNPLDLDHLSVDKMNFRDIIEFYEGDKRVITFPKQPVQHHPV
jgi:hypothetical protein